MTDDDDTEMELSSQLQEVNERSSGWSPWSDWSLCSRSCDGGTSQQIRSCKNGPCRGDHVRYKICNMQIFFVTSSVWAAPADPAVMKNPLEGSGQSSVALVPNGNNDAPGQQTIPAVLSNIPMAGTYLFPASDHHSLPTNPVDTLVVGPSGIIATGRALDSLAKSGGNLTPFLPGQTALTRGNDDQKSVQA